MTEYEMWFYGYDGEFAYHYGDSEHIEYLFRNPRVQGLLWSFDGDGWSSDPSVFAEAKQAGTWFIIRKDLD